MKSKNNFLAIAVLFVAQLLNAHAGDSIIVKQGSTPIIDGIISSTEWNDATVLTVASINGKIYLKHDASKLYVAFQNNAHHYRSTGIYLDPLHNAGDSPQSDDLWLHGSAGQFEWIGVPDSNWLQRKPAGWSYRVNSGNEYEIDFVKIGINPSAPNVLGVLFSFLDWSNGREVTWPAGGAGILNTPNVYADLFIDFSTSKKEISNLEEAFIYPNPASNQFYLKTEDEGIVYLYQQSGKLLLSEEINKMNASMDVSEIPAGVYVVCFESKGVIRRVKLILY